MVLCTDHSTDDWEITLLAGAAWYYDIPCKVVDLTAFPEHSERESLYVILVPYGDSTPPHRPPGITIRAGRRVTLDYIWCKHRPAEDEVLIYGEPYIPIQRMLAGEVNLDNLAGKAIIGPLLNPREYHTPPFEAERTIPRIMTSIGCEKKCGYCQFGATYSSLYPGVFARRNRPWQDLRNELKAGTDRGICEFILLADQFLSQNPHENRELMLLTENWPLVSEDRPGLTFTLSPREVLNNQPLLAAMARCFNLYPTLSIDSFDSNTLALLDLDFDPSMGLEAVKYLVALNLPLRINYIFGRPQATIDGVKEELQCLRLLAETTSHLTTQQKLLLAYDIFSRTLQITYGMPVALKADVVNPMPVSPAFTQILQAIVQKLNQERDKLSDPDGHDPLLNIIDTAQAEAARTYSTSMKAIKKRQKN
jgi:hypothetical protein